MEAVCTYILWTLGPFYGLLLYFMDIWYSSWSFGIFFPRFGILYQEKSGNPGREAKKSFGNKFFGRIFFGAKNRRFLTDFFALSISATGATFWREKTVSDLLKSFFFEA
jgi:hypothetical protein